MRHENGKMLERQPFYNMTQQGSNLWWICWKIQFLSRHVRLRILARFTQSTRVINFAIIFVLFRPENQNQNQIVKWLQDLSLKLHMPTTVTITQSQNHTLSFHCLIKLWFSVWKSYLDFDSNRVIFKIRLKKIVKMISDDGKWTFPDYFSIISFRYDPRFERRLM